MVRKLLILILVLPFTLSAQTKKTVAQPENVARLEQSKKALKAEIIKLQDSLKIVEHKLKVLQEEQQEQNSYNVEVQPEISQLRVKQNSVLLSRPHQKGKVVIKIEKGTMVQKIDKANGYYLVCLEGSCGYLPNSAFELNGKSGTK